MGFSLDVSVPVITVFIQGLISFFSPCVLPLLPLYLGYLSGGTVVRGEDGQECYDRKKVMLHTVFFVIGVSFAFYLLGLGVTALGSFFNSNHAMFARIGGILVVAFGLYQLGVFGTSKVLGTERRLPFRLDKLAMSPITALLMGFTFSFAWTPCVGPTLTSVLLMAASAATKAKGFLLIGVYTLGFILPFLVVGLFTTSLLGFFKKHRNVMKYTVKVGGVLMIFMGLLMFTGKMNDVTGYLSKISQSESSQSTEEKDKDKASGDSEKAEGSEGQQAAASDEEKEKADSTEEEVMPAIDFELKDQFGKTHKLEDYKGKTIFLNFWATWCPPCKKEMPDIQKLYETYDTEGEDGVIVLGVAAPNYGQEGSEEDIQKFLEENGYTYPVLMDTGGALFEEYGVYSYPTTFMIDRSSNVFGYVSGMITEDVMHSIIKQTQEGKREE